MDNTSFQPYSVFLRSSEYTSTSETNKSSLSFELNTPIHAVMLINLVSFKYTNSLYTINDNKNDLIINFRQVHFIILIPF
jgi:hypothetical protein